MDKVFVLKADYDHLYLEEILYASQEERRQMLIGVDPEKIYELEELLVVQKKIAELNKL